MVATAGVAHADPPDVAMNEIFYNAPSTDPAFAAVEFIELKNYGATEVDVSGWKFTAGITIATPDLALPAGTTIPAGGFLLGTSDPALFQSKYGFAADFSFTGTSLSNGGEQVTLVDATAAVIDAVLYDDAAPWPVSPDGAGPSLEYNSDGSDNSLAANWHASLAPFGSPRAENSIPPLPLTIGAPTAYPAAGQDQVLTATAPVGSAIDLTYKIMFGAEVTVPMLDDAASPGGADDGVYATTVPGAGEGELVRFKVSATRGLQSASHPAVGDSRPYDGYVHADSELASAQYPVLQWFMEDSVYQDMIANHRCDDVDANATFAWNGKVLDGGLMHIKGHSSCQDAKAKWDVELPAGYTFDFGAPYSYPLKGFDLQNENIPRPRLGWEMIGDSGEATAKYQTMRIHRNGSFFGVFGVLENLDSVWRANHGLKDAPFYKIEAGGLRTYDTLAAFVASGDVVKKNPNDGNYADIWELTQKLALPDGPAKWAWLQDNLDLPQIANYTALTVAMRHWDSGTKNYYFGRSPVTGRWQIYSWDLDGILNNASDPKGDFIFPSTDSGQVWRNLAKLPGFAQMHYRRARTLYDKLVHGPQLLARFDELTQAYAGDIQLDFDTWSSRRLSSSRTTTVKGIQERRNQFAAHTPDPIPTSQDPNASLVITEIQYDPAATQPEFLEVYNPASTAVDASGWTIAALGSGYTLAPGTVVGPRSYAVWTSSDAALKSTFGGTPYLMAGQYSGALDNAGEDITILDGARVVDMVTFVPQPGSDGTGASLELIDPALDNADMANWQVSDGPLATPGGPNGSVLPPVTSTVFDFGSTWSYAATGLPAGAWRSLGYDDTAWPSGPGSLGFNLGQTTTVPWSKNRWTYYFRHTVTIPAGPAIANAKLRFKRDDGAVIYVNGVEVGRSNMPTGMILDTTKASTGLGSTKANSIQELVIPASLLTVGENVIAVEVHQYTAGSTSDLLWDAQLEITR
ncbi:MAG: lamin tail domain-containing protein [Candidatus Lutibacillus vidarii]